ncbi:E3 ubiquitin-protein ligase RNF126 isoform X2 [Agrilus planipennis]|uniref:RING-type E3 ubiquitin transferase n=1 Tax=Agrilus planipennis TaxID=224129 RepID=A0A7F5QZH9_AGRPL|nr:E3 ubiquitin-protein ligase RNF126 isoform X2 [Agrilus planipennis]
MAEAAVEERPSQRFYCHICNVQFQNASANFTCPHCSGGFIEELEAGTENPEGIVDASDEDEPYYMLHSYPMDIADIIFAPGPEDHHTGQRFVNDAIRRRSSPRLATTNSRPGTQFEDLISEFIVNLGVGVNFGGGGNMQVFLGNPGDYAWGREGLDAIVTQLLNQMDGCGPPPLSKDVIDALPVVEITELQVESKLQCSVCWEDFELCENVRQLPCQHVYHEPCIRPWLELHGTCPICRQNLGSDDGSQNADNQASGGTTLTTLQQLFQAAQNPANRSGSPMSSAATRGSDSNSSSNSSFSNSEGI